MRRPRPPPSRGIAPPLLTLSRDQRRWLLYNSDEEYGKIDFFLRASPLNSVLNHQVRQKLETDVSRQGVLEWVLDRDHTRELSAYGVNTILFQSEIGSKALTGKIVL